MEDLIIPAHLNSIDAVQKYLAADKTLAQFALNPTNLGLDGLQSQRSSIDDATKDPRITHASTRPQQVDSQDHAKSPDTGQPKSYPAPRLPKLMLVVTRPDGTTFIPTTSIKNKSTATRNMTVYETK